MKRIKAAFTLTLGEFRMANYYGLFLRHQRALQILFGVLLFALVYYVGAMLGLGKPNPLVFLLAGAYLGWGLLLFAGTELDIHRYLRTPQNLIGCKFWMTIEDHHLLIEIPEREIRDICNLHKLACCFELNALFLFYTTPQDVYILPKRVLQGGDVEALRDVLAADLKESFSSRFLPKKNR